MSSSEGWSAPPGDEKRARGRRWLWVAIALTVLLVGGGIAATYIVTRTNDAGPDLDDATDQPLSGKRSDVEPGQRLLEAAGGVGPEPLIDPSDVIPGGPPPDGIPPIDDPKFVAVSEAGFLNTREPVISVVVKGDARAYPLQIMTWHEIANDTVGGTPVTVTFCPLCNTAYAFERPEVKGKVTTLGTSGLLYNSNLVMYDRATTSLWPQALGQAVIGPLTGTTLDRVPSQIVAWEDFRDEFPDGAVLSRDTGFDRRYGDNPYPGYDDISSQPFLFRGKVDERLAAMERVLGVEGDGETMAFPYTSLKEVANSGTAAANVVVGGEPMVVLWKAGAVSALDATQIASSKEVGASSAFSRRLRGRVLDFSAEDGVFVDEQTSSTWNLFGKATSGPLKGKRLRPADAHDSFWFDWVAFHPQTEIWEER